MIDNSRNRGYRLGMSTRIDAAEKIARSAYGDDAVTRKTAGQVESRSSPLAPSRQAFAGVDMERDKDLLQRCYEQLDAIDTELTRAIREGSARDIKELSVAFSILTRTTDVLGARIASRQAIERAASGRATNLSSVINEIASVFGHDPVDMLDVIKTQRAARMSADIGSIDE
jgi:hypothetical protein